MRITVHTEDDQFDALAPEWDALLARSITNRLFLTFDWQRAWWRAFGGGKSLFLLTMREDDGELVGIAPLFRHEVAADGHRHLPTVSIEHATGEEKAPSTLRGIFLIGGTEVMDYLDFIFRADLAEATYRELMAFLCDEVSGWDMLDLHNVPAASPTVGALTRLAEERNLPVAQEREDVCPVLTLPGNWEEYLSNLTKKQRHEIRRKRRRLYRELDATYSLVQDPSVFEEAMETFFQLHERSARDKAAFWTDEKRGFFLDVARTAMHWGQLHLSFLHADGEPLATYLSFEYNGEYLVYNSGFDPTRHATLSPGIVLAGHCIEDAMSRGIRRFDFLQGDERYKYDLGATDTEVVRLAIHSSE